METHLIGMNQQMLKEYLSELGEPQFRARQIFHWLYQRKVDSFREMGNIPKTFRTRLDELAAIHPLTKVKVANSQSDSARKFLFKLTSGELIEAVLMKDRKRITVCLSTQAGCALGCTFCATAKMGFQKNLSAGEIVDQFLLLQKEESERITNVVLMGMGEPFLNYRRVIEAAELLNHLEGISLSARKITISTAGVIPRIRQFADEKQRYKLAISLNATTQEQRLRVMPIAKTYPIDGLMTAAKYYYKQTHTYLTFEYVLMKGINDTQQDAFQLVDLIGDLPCKVNIIPYNDIGGDHRRPSIEQIESFMKKLYQAPFTVTVRLSKGTDIYAGCGQLISEKTVP